MERDPEIDALIRETRSQIESTRRFLQFLEKGAAETDVDLTDLRESLRSQREFLDKHFPPPPPPDPDED